MSFPRYPKYKDSGVEWLGQVPDHWSVISIKWLSPVKRGASPRPIDDPKYFDEEGEFAWVRIADVSACDGVLKETTQRLSGLGSSLSVKIEPGELFVSIAGTVGKPCLSAIKACIHDGFVYFPTLNIAPQFLYRIFESGTCYAGLGKWGTQLNFNTDTIGSIRIALPPDDELNRILAFLDRETSKIDALVAEQQRLIDLLKEKRQAVISHAVTKGLNPHAPIRPSGLEWLGDVPAHWSVTPISRLCRYLSYGFTNPMPTTDEGPYMLTANDVDYGKVKYESARRTSYDAYLNDVTEKSRPKKGDVLITKDGTLGRVAVHEGQEACINQSVASLRVNAATILPQFMATCLLAGLYQGRMIYDAGGTTIKHIYISRLAKMPVAYPSLPEQEAVLAFLAEELPKLDTLTAEAQHAIDLLQERRTALISAAVTGQIDVRHVEP